MAPPNAQFKPQWTPPLMFRAPKTPGEAQKLYNHCRTVAYMLDSSSALVPGLDQLPFEFGLEAVIGALLPFVGDLLGVFIGLYLVLLAFWFGGVTESIGLLNLFIDGVVGIVPVIGDILDVAFKANMHNLALLEKHLKRSVWAPVVYMPSAGQWRPSGRKDKPRVDLNGLPWDTIFGFGKGK